MYLLEKIKRVFNNFELEHTLDTRTGSSDSHIFLNNNRFVIGLHQIVTKILLLIKELFLVKYLIHYKMI